MSNGKKRTTPRWAEFERYCAGHFTRGDLDAVKTKLDLK